MKAKTDWVVTGGKTGELSHCTRCGDGLAMDMPQRVEVVTAAMNAFVKSHSACQPGHREPPTVTPREWLAGRICMKFWVLLLRKLGEGTVEELYDHILIPLVVVIVVFTVAWVVLR